MSAILTIEPLRERVEEKRSPQKSAVSQGSCHELHTALRMTDRAVTTYAPKLVILHPV
ncbi:hypothetical protein [Moorena sp. SIO3H5]|uniref:hypothetical protein n=1 Tax=Moorena sp. SIO3H5 TaxID=2607834 RepID=UPI0013BD1DAC|nr:hypothetical protein [Moorena sp. SIO3H5]NEO73795.1 hypothetical protein [Moorena sp. SIO3H5]